MMTYGIDESTPLLPLSFRLQHIPLEPESDGPLNSQSFLLLHGFGGDVEQLQGLARQLANAGAHCHCISLRGHGESIKPEFGYSCLDVAADILRLLPGLPKPLNLIGYSFGGLVAALLAHTLEDGWFHKLVIIDESFQRHPEFFRNDEAREARYFGWMFSWEHLLAWKRHPLLILRGQESHMISDEEAIKMANLAQVLDIPGDHGSCYRESERIAELVQGFVLKPDQSL